MKTKQVTVRLPKETITHVAKVAKMAGVSPTQVYNVLLAAYIAGLERPAPQIRPEGDK
jgi:hypothetical protein